MNLKEYLRQLSLLMLLALGFQTIPLRAMMLTKEAPLPLDEEKDSSSPNPTDTEYSSAPEDQLDHNCNERNTDTDSLEREYFTANSSSSNETQYFSCEEPSDTPSEVVNVPSQLNDLSKNHETNSNDLPNNEPARKLEEEESKKEVNVANNPSDSPAELSASTTDQLNKKEPSLTHNPPQKESFTSGWSLSGVGEKIKQWTVRRLWPESKPEKIGDTCNDEREVPLIKKKRENQNNNELVDEPNNKQKDGNNGAANVHDEHDDAGSSNVDHENRNDHQALDHQQPQDVPQDLDSNPMNNADHEQINSSNEVHNENHNDNQGLDENQPPQDVPQDLESSARGNNGPIDSSNHQQSLIPTPNAQTASSVGKWLGIGAGIAIIGSLLYRIIQHMKPAFDGSLDSELVQASMELKSVDAIGKQIKQDVSLCDELIKRAQEAQYHANDLQFLKALWTRAKQLDALVHYQKADVTMIDAFINHNDMEGLGAYLTDSVKPALLGIEQQVTKNRIQAQQCTSIAQEKRQDSSVFGLVTQGLTQDINKVTQAIGIGPLFNDTKENQSQDLAMQEEKQKQAEKIKRSLGTPTTTFVEPKSSSYEQMYQYLSGLCHIDQEAKKAVKQNQSKHAAGWFVTDMLDSKKCAALQNQLAKTECHQLKKQIGLFEQAFEIAQPTTRAVAIGQAYSDLKQCLDQLKNNNRGKKAKELLIALDIKSKNTPSVNKSTEPKTKPRPQSKYQSNKEELDVLKKIKRNHQPKEQFDEQGDNVDEQPTNFGQMPQMGISQLFAPALSWVKNNPLLALGLAAATAYGVWSELKGPTTGAAQE